MRYAGEDIGIFSRLGSALTYLTAGWGGVIIFIALYIAKKTPSRFFMFNFCQSIIIAFSLFVIGMTWIIIFNLLSHIPFIQLLVTWIDFIIHRPILLSRSITELFVAGLIIYCSVFSLFGKKPIIYKLSNLIKTR